MWKDKNKKKSDCRGHGHNEQWKQASGKKPEPMTPARLENDNIHLDSD